MTKTTSILFLCFFLTAGLSAQLGTHIEVDYTLQLQEGGVVQLTHEAGDNPHLSYFVEASPQDMESLQWRFSSIAPWTSISIDEHVSYEKAHFSRLQFSEQGQIDTLFLRTVGELTSTVFYHRYYPGGRPAPDTNAVDLRDGDCECPEPDIQMRMDWCANCPTTSTPVQHEPTHMIVHHSAGPNSSSDWSAVVRSIWDFHVNGRGWADIGYHYLIDPNGEIYQGRADNIQGAHFCAQNRNAMGMCVLGTFTNVAPASAARASWIDLAAYAACKWEVLPQSRSIHASSGLNLLGVSGHRDGCATACPGQTLYDQLPVWRASVAAALEECGPAEDSLVLTNSGTSFPFTIDLAWSKGKSEVSEYRLQVRPLNAGPLSGWSVTFPINVQQYRLGLNAETEYEIQIEGWDSNNQLQLSNKVFWETENWNTEASTRQLSPNPLRRGGEVQFTWTNDFVGDFKLQWIDMNGKVYSIGSRRKIRDTYIETLSCRQFPAGQYFLHLTYNGNTSVLALILY